MISSEQIAQLQDFLNPAQSVIVIVAADANLDMLAGAAGFFLALQATGKEVIFASSDLPGADPNLSGIDQIKTTLGHRNLSISFDYQETAVDKVSYHIGEQTNKFFLTIKPQKGHTPLDSSTVEFSYTGAEADLIFLFGVHNFESLDQLYYANEQLFVDTTVVSINTFETNIGHIKLNTSGDISLSCAIARAVRDLGMTVSSDAATNLLLGIEEVTNNFGSFSTTPETFETVAWLMRQGARRVKRAVETSTPAVSGQVVTQEETEVKPARSSVGQVSQIEEAEVVSSLKSSSQSVGQPAGQTTNFASAMQKSGKSSQKTVVRKSNKKSKAVRVKKKSNLRPASQIRQKKAASKKAKAGGLDHQPGMMSSSR